MPKPVLVAARIVLVIQLVVIAVLSLQPAGVAASLMWDKLAHALAYLSVAAVLVLAIRNGPSSVWQVLLLVAGAAAYGLAIEFVQRLVGRQFDPRDMLANAIGAMAGGVLGLLVRRMIVSRSGNGSRDG